MLLEREEELFLFMFAKGPLPSRIDEINNSYLFYTFIYLFVDVLFSVFLSFKLHHGFHIFSPIW